MFEPSEKYVAEAERDTGIHGAEIDAKDEIGWTPLFLAVHNGYQGVASLLHRGGASLTSTINAGADRNMTDCNGKTAHQLSIEMGEFECALMVK